MRALARAGAVLHDQVDDSLIRTIIANRRKYRRLQSGPPIQVRIRMRLRISMLCMTLFSWSSYSSAQEGAPLPPPGPAAEATLPQAEPTGAAPLTRENVDAWLDGYMPYALQTGDIAGAVVVVVKDGQVLTQRGFGYADVATRKPVDP